MSVKAILTIDGKKFNLLQGNYNFSRYTDISGYGSNIIRFERIILILPSYGDIFFLNWMFTPELQKSGSISYYDDEDKIKKIKRVVFAGAFCVGFKEVYHSVSSMPMYTELTISAGGIKIEESEFRFPWFKGAFKTEVEEVKDSIIEYVGESTPEKIVPSKPIETPKPAKNKEIPISNEYIQKATNEGLTLSQAKISQAVVENAPNNTPIQNSSNLDELYKNAAIANEELKSITLEISKATGGVPGFRNGLKGKERAIEKINSDYNGDASKLIDIAGSKIVFDNLEELYQALDIASQKIEIIRIKDRFIKPIGGYRDILMNVKMSNGHIVEFRLHLKSIDEISEVTGHHLYEQLRTIDAVSKTRPLTDEEKVLEDDLQIQMKKQYDDGWKIITDNNK